MTDDDDHNRWGGQGHVTWFCLTLDFSAATVGETGESREQTSVCISLGVNS